jgi:short subunit dehydrogenase-like uncharacterized protein
MILGVQCSNVSSAALSSSVILFSGLFLLFPPCRWILARIMPPGTGPSKSARNNGYFNVRLFGESEKVHNMIIFRTH